MSLDVEAALQETLSLKPKDFARYFTVDEVGDNIRIAIRRDSRGKFVWLETSTFYGVDKYVRGMEGSYFKEKREWTIPLSKVMQPKQVASQPKTSISLEEEKASFPIPLQQPQKEEVQRITYEDEWLDNVIHTAKYVMEELTRQTFKRYREIGKIVLKSGYAKGTWKDKHKHQFINDLGISRPTFTRMVQLGTMEEEEFVRVTNQFSSFYQWTHQSSKQKQTEKLPLPQGEFNVIYADPPWRYNVSHLRGNPEKYYPSMTLEEISKLEIPSSENTILFLWTTNPMLEDALTVLEAWGFQYKTNIVWIKDKFGTGFYVRGQHEILLIGVKGDVHPPEEANRFPSILKAPVKQHSQKPTEVYDIIEKMYPNAHYLELFARQKREGWEAWGNEV